MSPGERALRWMVEPLAERAVTLEVREAAILAALCQHHVTARRGVEVGVYDGALSALFLEDLPDLAMTLVDHWRAPDPASAYAATGDSTAFVGQDALKRARRIALAIAERFAPRVTVLTASSLAAAGRTPQASVDFAFIDADHSFEAVRQDLAAWWPKVRPGGLLCGHDWGDPALAGNGVRRAVEDWLPATGSVIELGEDHTWFVRRPT